MHAVFLCMPRPKKKSTSNKVDLAEDLETGSYKRRKACPDCGSADIMFDTDTEQLICHDCGLLFEELVESGEESDELDLF